MRSFDGPPESRALAESRRGYFLAVLGGVLGAPLGLILSPVVLFLLTRLMQRDEEDEVVPNRFAVWALIGIVGAPLSLIASNPELRAFYQRAMMPGSAAGAFVLAPFPQRSKPAPAGIDGSVISGNPGPSDRAAPSMVEAGGFTLSNVSIRRYEGDADGIDYAGELWVVYADMTNRSKELRTPSQVLSVELMDAEGRTFDSVDFAITSNSVLNQLEGGAPRPDKFSDGILPGATRDNVQVGVFDVTRGVRDLRLCAGELLYPGKTCLRGESWGGDAAHLGS